MILPLAGLILGAIHGVLRARARKGTRADAIQWAIAHALGYGLIGLFAMITIDRLLS